MTVTELRAIPRPTVSPEMWVEPEFQSRVTLRNLSEIRAFFRTNETPIYFISPTPFNLLGIDRWVRNFYFISYYDSFEGAHPRVFVPKHRPAHEEFESIEDVCNYLLRDPEVADFISRHGPGGKATFVMFNEETERLAGELGLEIIHPPFALRQYLDSKSSRRGWAMRPVRRACRTCSAGPTAMPSCSTSRRPRTSAPTSSSSFRTATPAGPRSSSPRRRTTTRSPASWRARR